MAAPAHTLNLCGVLSESKRIINAHSRHFLALSVLFLLPLSFSLIIYPTLQATLSQPNSIFHHHAVLFLSYISPPHLKNTTEEPPQSLLLPVLFSLFVIFLSLCATATVTYSTIHGFYGRPVKIVSSLKSLLFSFIRLCSTFVVCQIMMGLVGFLVVIFAKLVCEGFEALGFEIDLESNYVIWVLAGLVLVGVLMWLQLNWGLGLVVVVVESKWGYEPLRRSAHLIKGMRGVAFSMVVLFGMLIWFFTWGCSRSVINAGGVSGWKSWAFIFQTVVSSGFVTLLMLHNMAANAVLYMYCKALHGELALEIVEEFAREYVSLPFDDSKVPHVVSVVHV